MCIIVLFSALGKVPPSPSGSVKSVKTPYTLRGFRGFGRSSKLPQTPSSNKKKKQSSNIENAGNTTVSDDEESNYGCISHQYMNASMIVLFTRMLT